MYARTYLITEILLGERFILLHFCGMTVGKEEDDKGGLHQDEPWHQRPEGSP